MSKSEAVSRWAMSILATLIGTVLTVGSEVLAGFLTPLRIGSIYTPVSWVVCVLGVFAGVWVARVGSGSGAATILPVIGWFYALYQLTTTTSAGDLVITGSWVGYGMLLLGVTAMLVALYYAVVRPAGPRAVVPSAGKPTQRAPGKR